MFYTTLRFASHVQVPKKHIPMIRFLGKRSLLNESSTQETKDTKETQASPSDKSFTVDKYGTVSYFINDERDLPQRYRRKAPSSYEAEIIESGGAIF